MKLFYIGLIFIFVLGILVFKDADVSKTEDSSSKKLDKATFAGGCFWCMQPAFDKLKGVVSTTVGYTGGHTKIQPMRMSPQAIPDTLRR